MNILSLTPEALAVLRQMVAAEVARTVNVPNRQPETYELTQAPEVYIARTPDGGIPPLNQATTGTGTPGLSDDAPGHADCDIYRLIRGTMEQVVGLSRTVYNLGDERVGVGGRWVQVKRDKFGTWWVEPQTAAAPCTDNPNNFILTYDMVCEDERIVKYTYIVRLHTDPCLTIDPPKLLSRIVTDWCCAACTGTGTGPVCAAALPKYCVSLTATGPTTSGCTPDANLLNGACINLQYTSANEVVLTSWYSHTDNWTGDCATSSAAGYVAHKNAPDCPGYPGCSYVQAVAYLIRTCNASNLPLTYSWKLSIAGGGVYGNDGGPGCGGPCGNRITVTGQDSSGWLDLGTGTSPTVPPVTSGTYSVAACGNGAPATGTWSLTSGQCSASDTGTGTGTGGCRFVFTAGVWMVDPGGSSCSLADCQACIPGLPAGTEGQVLVRNCDCSTTGAAWNCWELDGEFLCSTVDLSSTHTLVSGPYTTQAECLAACASTSTETWWCVERRQCFNTTGLCTDCTGTALKECSSDPRFTQVGDSFCTVQSGIYFMHTAVSGPYTSNGACQAACV